jgi:hypothetical protein
MAGAAPHRPWACQGHMTGRSLLSGDDEISPAWEGHCKDAPSLMRATMTKDRQILCGKLSGNASRPNYGQRQDRGLHEMFPTHQVYGVASRGRPPRVGVCCLQGLPRLVERTTPIDGEGPHHDTVLALLQHYSMVRFYLPTPCTSASLEL